MTLLTSRELEVLGHLADLLSTQETAAVMFGSVNTVRTHVRSILRKLGCDEGTLLSAAPESSASSAAPH